MKGDIVPKAGRKSGEASPVRLPNRFAELLAIKERVNGRQWTRDEIQSEIKMKFGEDISLDTLSRYYNNRVEKYEGRVVRVLADWIGVSVTEFWVRTDPPNPYSPKIAKADPKGLVVAGMSGSG